MKTVLMAMSGGVDSAVAAKLLLQAGYDVTALTMVFNAADANAARSAASTCRKLGISHRTLDLQTTFKEAVVARYVDDYRAGLTPNPCMVCNQTIKFGTLFDAMQRAGYDYLATGHYAQVVQRNWRYFIKRAATRRRDQSYFLYHLTQRKLRRLLLPLGGFKDKSEVVAIARQFDGALLERSESVGVCFTRGANYANWLSDQLADAAGDIVDVDGRVIGVHDGYFRYTIGQKRNLPADLAKGCCVLRIDAAQRRVVVGPEALCYAQRLTMERCHFNGEVEEMRDYKIKIFNWGYFLSGRVASYNRLTGTADIAFYEPVRAIAPGQYAVLYDDEGLVLGGGRIVKILD